MRKGWKRITAIFLALVMMVPSIPVQALAAMDDDDILAPDTAYDEDIDQAKEDMEVLEAAGIADETGSMVDLDIREDGNSVELSELTNRIASGKTVGAITVNGKSATPEQILKIGQVQSELELAKLLDQDIEITDEHVENLESLITGIADGSIDMDEAIERGMLSMSMADEDSVAAEGSGPEVPENATASGQVTADEDGKYAEPYISDSTYEASHAFTLLDKENTWWYSEDDTDGLGQGGTVTITCQDTATSNGSLKVYASLDKAQKVPVSFDISVSGGGIGVTYYITHMEWAAGESGEKDFTVYVNSKGSNKWDGNLAFVINAGNIKNASFVGGKTTWSKVVTVNAADHNTIKDSDDYVWETEGTNVAVTGPADRNGFYRRYIGDLSNIVNKDKIKLTFNYTTKKSSGNPATQVFYLVTKDATTTTEVNRMSQIPDRDDTGDHSDTVEVSVGDNNTVLFEFLSPNYNECSLSSINVKERVAPRNAAISSISVPGGLYGRVQNYYSGQVVPVTVHFDTYVAPSADTKLTVNGSSCPLLDVNIKESKTLTFGYTVKDVDTGEIKVTGLTGGLNNYFGQSVTLGSFPTTGTTFGIDQCVTLVSDIKRAGLDWSNVKAGIDDGDPGAQVVTVLVPFTSGADKNWVTSEAVGCTENGQGISLPLPGYENASATAYLAGAYFSYDDGKTRFPVYIVSSGSDEAAALATRFVPAPNGSSCLRKDTLDLFLDPLVLGTAEEMSKYLPAWSDKKTDEKGFAYFEGEGKDVAPILLGKNVSYYVKGGVMFEPVEYTERPSDSYDANDQGDVKPGFLKLKDHKGYVVLQDEDITRQYDVEIVVSEAWYEAYVKGVRAESPADMTIGYQFSSRKNFSFTNPKYFTWDCYRVDSGSTDSDETVSDVKMAQIEVGENGVGNILFTGEEGRARFILNVKNGSAANSYTLDTKGRDLTVLAGKDPFLNIPTFSRVRTTLTGTDTDVLFASNVTARNAAVNKNTTFAAKLYNVNSESDDPSGSPVWTNSFTSTIANTLTHITVPGGQLLTPGVYAVVISTTYEGGVVMDKDTAKDDTLSATAYLQVKQGPAKVTLDPLDSYYVTSDDIPEIKYTVSPANAAVEYTIQKSGTALTGGDRKPASGGKIEFTPNQLTGLKDAYTITVYAKNDGDESWSADSMLLTVYNNGLLDILVKDVAAGEIGGTTEGTGTGVKNTTVTMDNHGKLNGYGINDTGAYQLTFNDFNTLRTDMSLQKIISANYGSGVWGMLSDKIQWASDDPGTVSVDYKQGGLYSDIRNYSYVSYAPATDFLLVGKGDTGKNENNSDKYVTITATHANTGMKASIKVTTKTLTDQLYVFQFQPKATTTVTYINGNNVTRNLTSNEKGELAVYEPDGIDSAIMTTSTVGGETYVGTLYPSELLSGERDIAALQSYPCNNLRLRPIANAALNILKPDGKPYSGAVTIRAGVYKNGVYCPGAKVKTAQGNTEGYDGKTDISATVTSGRLNLWFDPLQFNISTEETGGLKFGDTVTYVVEYRAQDCQPGYAIINAYSNLEGAAKPTDSIIQLKSLRGDAKLPQITRQLLQQYSGNTPTGYTRDVIDYTENIGISKHFDKAELITDVALPDVNVTPDTETGYSNCESQDITTFAIYTMDGRRLTGQGGGEETQVKQIVNLENLTGESMLYLFPFSSTVMGRSVYTMTDENMKADGITDEGTNASSSYSTRVRMLFMRDGLTVKNETLPFGVSNLSHQEDLGASGKSAEKLGGDIKKEVRNTVDIGSIFKQINVNDMIRKGFVFLSGLSGKAGDNMMNMMILPTEDPSTFRIMVFVGYNKKEDREGNKDKNLSINYDADALYDDAENFEKELDEMFKDDDDDDEDDDDAGEGSLEFNFYGTIMLDARLGISDGNWNIRFVGGNVGTNVEGKYEWSQNFMCGPVPVLVSFEVGFTADLEVAFGDKKGTQAMLIDAAMGVSLEAFAGLGFDLSLVAFKLGIFGNIGADVDFLYLVPANKTGTKLDIDGEVGLRMEVKVLFVKYKKTFCSTGFGWSKKWGKYDEIQNAWATGDVAQLSGLTASGRNYNMQLMPNGTAFVEIDGEGEIDNRDYLELADRAWNGGSSGGGRRLLRAAAPLADALNNVQTNAYPYANPVFVDDGSMFLYISDNNNADELQSVVSYAVQSGGSYENKGALVTDESNILADSDVVASGSGSNIFAAWVKQHESPEKEMKDKATYDDLGMMMNATEVYAGVYDSSVSSNWVTTRLTDNTVADMAPTIASYGDRAIVAWRSLAATELPEDGTEQDITASFNAENNINYRIYNGGSSLSWNEVKVAYNGAAGTVNAIDSAMLSDGTALLTYTVRTGEDVTSTETFYTLIGTDGEVVTTGRLTNNETTDTNAQVSAVGDQFVVGWYSEYETGEESEVPDLSSAEMRTEKVLAHDISLARINGNGSVDVNFPESIGGESGSGISSDFRFSAPAGNTDINKLSVVWSEKNEEDQYELNAVRFYTDGENIGVTTKTDIAKTGKRCSVDRFDTFTGSDGKVYTLILCSDYSSLNGLDVYDTIDLSTHGLTVLDGNNDAEPSDSMLTVLEQDPLVNILLGSGTFTQKDIEVETQTDLKELTPGLDLPVQFEVKNVGTDTVDSITASIGTTNKTFSNLSLLPGQSAALVMEYPVPETVTDVDYTVTAEGGSAKTGTLVLNRPDVGISGMKILNEIDRKRDIQVTLHNRSGIPLAGSGKKVKLAFYKDSAYSDQIGATVDIDESTYADIDGGFGTYTQSVNVSDIIGASAREIPDEGVSVYARAWVEEAALVEGKPVVVEELYPNDNESMISFKGLLTKYGEKLTMDGVLIPGDEGKYTIQADIRNNSLQPVYLSEIRAKVLDENGGQIGDEIILKDNEESEIELSGEERKSPISEPLTPDGTPASVQIEATVTITVSEVTEKIAALPAFGDVTEDDREAIEEAREAYEALTANQKAKIAVETLKKLTDAEDKLVILPVMSEVSAKNGGVLIYTGKPYELINTPTTALPTGYTMVYAVTDSDTAPTEESAYSAEVPTGTDVGTYHVWYMVKGDAGHSSTEPVAVEVKIRKIEIKSIRLRAISGTTMVPGTSQQLEAILTPSEATADVLTWTSSDTGIATVEGGRVTIKPNDQIAWGDRSSVQVTITAAADKAVSSITILVKNVEKAVTGINIDSKAVRPGLKPGDTFRLTAEIAPYDATDKTVTWTSSDTDVAEIGPTGIVTIKGFGKTTITVVATNGNKDTLELEIGKTAVTGVTINPVGGDDYLVVGRSTRLTAAVEPDDASVTDIQWSSSDDTVATVDESGTVKGLKAGRVTIAATSKDDGTKKATQEFIVFESEDSLYVEFEDGPDYTYTGKAITPTVNVYYRGKQLLGNTDYTVSYKNNKNANAATNIKKAPKVVVNGKTVAAKAEAMFRILPIDIGDETLVSAQEIYITPGKTATPILYFGGTKLKSRNTYSDGIIIGSKNIENPFEKTKFNTSRAITVYGVGNFTGKREIWVNVKSAAEVKKVPSIKITSFKPVKRYYNGKPQVISANEITVVSSADRKKVKTPLVMNKDFYIAYPNDNTNVGTVKIAIIGMGDYAGYYSRSYRIEAAKYDSTSVESISINFPYREGEKEVGGTKYDTFTYKPTGVKPYAEVRVSFKNGQTQTLSSGSDYMVTYKNFRKAGAANKDKPATATISFRGNYKNLKKLTKDFYITQAKLSEANILLQNKVTTKAQPNYLISAPIADIGGDKINKNEYMVTYKVNGSDITGRSKLYKQLTEGESITVDVEVKAKTDKNGKEIYNYTGTQKGKYLITRINEGQDLSKAKVIIKKKGDSSFKNVGKLGFTGNRIVIGKDEYSDYELYVYMGKNVKDPAKKELKEGVDYTVSYSNNVNAGKATIILNAKDGSKDYYGSKTFNFNIVKGKMRWVK